MQKFIKVGNDGDLIQVTDVYSFIYEHGTGKQVLRIIVDPAVKTYDELYELFANNTLPIKAYYTGDDQIAVMTESSNLVGEYTNYCKDYKCSFNCEEDYPNQYFIEITRKTQAEILAEKNQEAIDANNLAIVELYEANIA